MMQRCGPGILTTPTAEKQVRRHRLQRPQPHRTPMEIIPVILVSIAFLAAIVGYLWSVAWAIGDAQRRGQGGGFIFVLFWLFGPLAALVWLGVRPTQSLTERMPDDYTDPDDAMAAASHLDSLGDWDAAVSLYRSVAERWPEHSAYIDKCVSDISRKQSASAG